jgi:predicted enzyme related to lactoylglutathione lyase
MDNAVGWFEIYVQDPERSRKFYEQLFGVKLEKLPYPGADLWAFPMKPTGSGCSGALVHMPGFSRGGNSVLVYFVCEDCAQQASKAVQLGGKLHKGKTSIGEHGHFSLVVDPEGNMIGLHSMK